MTPKIEYKNVTRPKVTIAKNRFDVKIPIGTSKEAENIYVKEAINLFNKVYDESMQTYREHLRGFYA